MKLVRTTDGIFEATESVPTPEQRAIGNKVLIAKLKTGSKAARFLKVERPKNEQDPKVVTG